MAIRSEASDHCTEAGRSRNESLPAFEAVYDEYFASVWRSLLWLGVTESSVDEAAQDVFLVVYEKLGQFEARSSLATWLHGVVLRIASGYRRSAKRRSLVVSVGDTRDLEHWVKRGLVDGPEDDLAAREGARLIYRILDELDEQKRVVFVLWELQQMRATEIAELLGINVNTVHSRLRYAREEFERALARSRNGAKGVVP